jgi:hypothetical protein
LPYGSWSKKKDGHRTRNRKETLVLMMFVAPSSALF